MSLSAAMTSITPHSQPTANAALCFLFSVCLCCFRKAILLLSSLAQHMSSSRRRAEDVANPRLSARNTRRRKNTPPAVSLQTPAIGTRRSECSGCQPAVVTRPTSIRNSARNPTRHTHNTRSGSHYTTRARASNTEGPAATHEANLPEDEGVGRECYCDIYCKPCLDTGGTAACSEEHQGVYCSGTCGRWFHAKCFGGKFTGTHIKIAEPSINRSTGRLSWGPGKSHELGPNSQDDPWYCVNCKPPPIDDYHDLDSGLCPDSFARELCLSDYAVRLGYDVTDPPDGSPRPESDAAFRHKLDTYRKSLTKIVGDTVMGNILRAAPLPYPSLKPMDKTQLSKHAVWGRRFELMLMHFTVEQCSCCGITKPHASDPWYPTKGVGNFQRDSLTEGFKSVHACRCTEECGGLQFYASSKPKEKAYYSYTHGGLALDNANDFVSSTLICDSCYKDVAQNAEKKPELSLPRTMSERNGYGPGPVVVETVPDEDDDEEEEAEDGTGISPIYGTHASAIARSISSHERELHYLLSILTAAEEAAIRQITPLVSLVRLQHGNFGIKGNATCVWQRSQINKVLPNLPKHCKVIVIGRSAGDQADIRLESYRFSRERIERVLVLLKATGHPAYSDIEISTGNLACWPLEGSLVGISMDLPQSVTNTSDAPSDPSTEASTPATNNAGGDSNATPATASTSRPPVVPTPRQLFERSNRAEDGGPAPLQLDEEEDDVVYDGTMPKSSDSYNSVEASNVALGAFSDLAAALNARLAMEDGGRPAPMDVDGPEPDYGELNVRMSGNEAHLDQAEALPLGGFASMRKEPFAWTKAFPTVFVPTRDPRGNGFKIRGDFTGSDGPTRRNPPRFHEWAKWLMWRGDGRAAKHRILPLVLHNEIVRGRLFAQGRVSIALDSRLDADISIDRLREEMQNADSRHRLQQRVQYFVGNVGGTDQFHAANNRKFKATAFHHSYHNNKAARIFHTGSMAEFHDPFLRHLLFRHVSKVRSPQAGQLILESDAAFSKAVRDNKQVVTTYFACKVEMWLSNFLRPVFGIDDFMLCYEFAKSRGAIHFHGIGFSKSRLYLQLERVIGQAAIDVVDRIEELDEFIQQHLATGETDPTAEPDLPPRLAFFQSHPEHKAWYRDWDATHQAALREAGTRAGEFMEAAFNVSSMHYGLAPKDWRKSAGGRDASMGYRTRPGPMLSKAEVMEKGELKLPKFERESNLCERRANMINHAWSHSCSAYCMRNVTVVVDYLEGFHQVGKLGVRELFTAPDGKQMVRLDTRVCRMHFGTTRAVPYAGCEGDVTGGIEAIDHSQLSYDKNGQPKLVAQRNHPVVVQHAMGLLHWGANSDMQFLMVGPAVLDHVENEINMSYEHFVQKLHTAGMGGLEPFSSESNFCEYVCGYACKGSCNSAEWNDTLRALIENRQAMAEDATLKDVINKFMFDISKARNVPRDEAVYILAGGKYVYNTSILRPASITAVDLSDIIAPNTENTEGGNPPSTKSGFTFLKVKKAYDERDGVDVDDLNLYQFAADYYDKKHKFIPWFFGYDTKATWPLSESYSKHMLLLYKKHRGPLTSLLLDKDENGCEFSHRSFAAALEAYMGDSAFPKQHLVSIVRKKMRWQFNPEEGGAFGGDDPGSTPASQREDEEGADHEAAAAAAAEAADFYGEGTEHEADLDEAAMAQLDDGGPGIDWTCGVTPQDRISHSEWLEQYREAFYSSTANEVVMPFVLKEPNKYHPRKAQGQSQKAIVSLVLAHLKKWLEYELDVETNGLAGATLLPPPSLQLYVQGNPGTGKTFVIRCCRNICRVLTKRMDRDIASAPTGCAASLIDGETTVRSAKIPCSKKKFLASIDSNLTGSPVEKDAFSKKWVKALLAIDDEHSMSGRPTWAWREDRIRHAREANVNMDPHIKGRAYGGVPIMMSLGDAHQLPPVAMKSHFDERDSKGADANNADAIGKVKFADFLSPPPTSGSCGVSVIMDETFRQKDHIYKDVIQEMRDGNMSSISMAALMGRRLRGLPVAEQAIFQSRALYVCPTWKDTLPITISYLQSLQQPCAHIRTIYSYPGAKNHASKDVNFPARSALCVGAAVMLLSNFIVELGLFNGAIGTIVEIVYDTPIGSRKRIGAQKMNVLPLYVVVDFPELKIPLDKAWDPNHPSWVPIPCLERRCEKKCCSAKSIPLRVCKAITIYKSQGMTVGPNQVWEYLVVILPMVGSKPDKTPGLLQVAFSRCGELKHLAILDSCDSPLSEQRLKQIGKGPSYMGRNAFEAKLRDMAPASQAAILEMLEPHDPLPGPTNLDRAWETLWRWYDSELNAN